MDSLPKFLLVQARKLAVFLAVTSLSLVAGTTQVVASTQINIPDSVRHAIEGHVQGILRESGNVEFDEILFLIDPRRNRPEVRLLNLRSDDIIPSWSITLEQVGIEVDLRSVLTRNFKPSAVAVKGVRARYNPQEQLTVQSEAMDPDPAAPNILAVVSSALSSAGLADVQRLTVTDLKVTGFGPGQSAGISGGWLSMTGTEASKQVVGGFSATVAGNIAGAIRFDGQFDIAGGLTGINATFNEVDLPRLQGLLPGLNGGPVIEAMLAGGFEARLSPEGKLEQLNGSAGIGQGMLQLPGNSVAMNINSMRVDVEYSPDNDRFNVTGISVDLEPGTATGSGHVAFVDRDTGGWIEGQVELSDVNVRGSNVFETPLAGLAASGAFKVEFEPFLVQFAHFAARIEDTTIAAEGEIGVDNAQWFGRATVSADVLGLNNLMRLWPTNLVSNPRNWIKGNISSGILHEVSGVIAYSVEDSWNTRLNFQFEGGTLRYLPTLPPATNVAGFGELTNNAGAFEFEHGIVSIPDSGQVELAGSDMVIPNIWDGREPSTIRLNISGRLHTMLSILDFPPYRLLEISGINPGVADSNAYGKVEIKLPLLKKLAIKDVEFVVDGGLSEFRSGKLAGDVEIDADHLSVSASNEEVAISGTGTINGIAGSGTWRMGIGPDADKSSLLVGKINVSQRLLDEFGITAPGSFLKGSLGADYFVSMTPGAPAQFGIAADITDSEFDLPFLLLVTSGEEAPKLLLEGRLGETPEVSRISVDGTEMKAEGRFLPVDDGVVLGRLEFSDVRIGDWFHAPVRVDIEQGGDVRIELAGGTVDLRKIPDMEIDSMGGGIFSQPVSMRLDRLIFNSKVTLTDLVGEVAFAGAAGGRLTGKINGGQLVGIEVAPTANGLGAYLVTDNAGAAMRDAGVVSGLHGGGLELSLLPTPEKGAYSGQMRMINATVRDMPTLSEILSIVSIVGLLDQLVSKGISFSEVEAQFHVDRDTVNLIDATAIGPSIGIKMSGIWHIDESQVNLEGVITPFNPVSELARITPLQLIGIEKGAGFGAISFSVKGPTEDLSATANPLSAITPGFFKDLFNF